MNRLRTVAFAALAAVPAIFVSAASDAGQGGLSAGATCGHYRDGVSGYCEGSLSGFLRSSDPYAYASFWNAGPMQAAFSAELGNAKYACTTTNPPPQWFTLTSAPPSTYFFISWGPDSTCGTLTMDRQSNYQ
jgi:hypothetical protein